MAVLTRCNSFTDANQILGNRDRKKIGHNTYLQRAGDDIEAIYHSTAVVTYHPNNTMTCKTGGWQTVTTKDRLNQLTPLRIGSTKGIWYANSERFFDGIICDTSGQVLNPLPKADADATDAYNKAMRKQIKTYIDGYLQALIVEGLPMPSNGDCWYCLGMLESDDHLLDHMEESYFVPMLAVNAMREAGYQDTGISIFLDMHSDDRMGGRSTQHGTRVHTDIVRRSLRKYMQKRLLKKP